MNTIYLREQLRQFLIEDIGYGDLSSELIDERDESVATVIAKEHGVFCGKPIVRELAIMQQLDLVACQEDGSRIAPGDVLIVLKGKTRVLLETERVLLNVIQRMSGIATMTRQCVDALGDDSIHVTDTRKTTPGLRMLEKYAVRVGGGYNHRLRLDDAVMIKDNHIVALGGVAEAVHAARSKVGHTTPIEVEVESFDQLVQAIQVNPDIVMLDNRTPDELREWVRHIPNHITIEVSGGITLDTIADYRGIRIDVISLGQLTHSVRALDCSMNLQGGMKYATTRNTPTDVR
ncbi:carboxylating nicotinate-nucleotide diphosphorylase [Exiguobacterium aestuarii]|uniref:nicotinate-nucleotide diphosphorylase (carboxylating) n=1 Tax=Exiguobacterium aestuarii TaxID=273527 RepID=A0ABW2PM67_9BACL|nr:MULTISPECIES: carboxylating nicotinate-nucleotide diphosphorylase [Exiguobacterium]MCT4785205.1 carboxylating nicotinate-nucleotide diphosphorylase [Exiguobacterium aestuarii]